MVFRVDNFSLTAELWMHIIYEHVLHTYLNLKVNIIDSGGGTFASVSLEPKSF